MGGFNELLLSVLTYGDLLNTQLLCSLLHKIWSACNLQLYKHKIVNLVRVAEDALDVVMKFNRRNPEIGVKQKSLVHSALESNTKDVHLVQVDAGVSNEGFVPFGCIFKNHEKDIILSTSKRERIIVEPVVAEMLAIRWSRGVRGS